MLLSMSPGDMVISEGVVQKMAKYGKCGYCGTDTTRIAELRTDARFCSKEHQKAYWTDKRRIERTVNVALTAIEALQAVAIKDSELGDEALVHLIEIAKLVDATRTRRVTP